MKKLINGVETLLTESLSGFAAAHGDIVALGEEGKFVRRRDLKRGKVGLISGGGSGHEPLHAGFVGLGMLDAACPGQGFPCPPPPPPAAGCRRAGWGGGGGALPRGGGSPPRPRQAGCGGGGGGETPCP